MWRYIDPDGQVQGPFSAREMHTWYDSNYLQMELPICGMVRCRLYSYALSVMFVAALVYSVCWYISQFCLAQHGNFRHSKCNATPPVRFRQMQLSSYACVVQLGAMQERKVSPPDLPPPELYKSMGQMLQQVVRGNRFRPVTVKDVAAAAAKNASKVLLLFATAISLECKHIRACKQAGQAYLDLELPCLCVIS